MFERLFKDNRPKLSHRVAEVRERFNAFAASIDEKMLMMRPEHMTVKEQCHAIQNLGEMYRSISTWSCRLVTDAAYSGVYKADVDRHNTVKGYIKYTDQVWSDFLEMQRRHFNITT